MLFRSTTADATAALKPGVKALTGLLRAFADRRTVLTIAQTDYSNIRQECLDVLQLLPVDVQIRWVNMWLKYAEKHDNLPDESSDTKMYDAYTLTLRQKGQCDNAKGWGGYYVPISRKHEVCKGSYLKDFTWEAYLGPTLYALEVRKSYDTQHPSYNEWNVDLSKTS